MRCLPVARTRFNSSPDSMKNEDIAKQFKEILAKLEEILVILKKAEVSGDSASQMTIDTGK
jgi:hypothetical protein